MTPKEALIASGLPCRPGLTEAELAAVTKETPDLPREVRELLLHARGIEGDVGPAEWIDFAGVDGFGLEEIFPAAAPIATDGTGNHWVVDVDPYDGRWGAVYYACHDPPVIVVQAATFAAFI